jgi:3-oxoadipate enol-lactonase
MPDTETRPRLHYCTWGQPSSPPLLLIMGLGLGSEAWVTLPNKLAARHRVLAFDNRGTGLSEPPLLPYTMKGLADDAARVLDAAHVAQADVFGISMGGMIAQELVLRHPSRVRRLVLGCTQAGWLFAARPSLETLVDLWEGLHKRASEERLARMLLGPEALARPDVRARFQRWNETGLRSPRRRPELQALALLLHETRRRLSRIRAPTLVLAGDADRLVPLANVEALARAIPGARLQVLRGAGHVFPVEREEETIAAIEAHLG